jgi:spore germination protein GerM
VNAALRLVAVGAMALAAAGCAEREDAAPRRAAGAEHGPPATRTVHVYFRRDDGCDVVPVERIANGTRTLDFAWAALEMLLEGPTAPEAASGLASAIPDSARVWRYAQSRVAFGQDRPYPGDAVSILDVHEEEGGVLYVDFSPEIESFDRRHDSLCAMIKQIDSTGSQFDEYQAVRIAVGGKTNGILQP